MIGPVLVDANVLVYWKDDRFPDKRQRADLWLDVLWRDGHGRVSTQVLNEAYNTLTRKLSPPYPVETARAYISTFAAWRPVAVDFSILRDAWWVMDGAPISFWDALVLSAARRASCKVLLTEDLQDGATYAGIKAVNPFRHEPSEIDQDE